jgi:hypothetical protein
MPIIESNENGRSLNKRMLTYDTYTERDQGSVREGDTGTVEMDYRKADAYFQTVDLITEITFCSFRNRQELMSTMPTLSPTLLQGYYTNRIS